MNPARRFIAAIRWQKVVEAILADFAQQHALSWAAFVRQIKWLQPLDWSQTEWSEENELADAMRTCRTRRLLKLD